MNERDSAWRAKANRIIGALCKRAHEQANRLPNGRLRKRHVPYSVPDTAAQLVRALGTDNEEAAKAIFLFNYDVQGLTDLKG